MGSDGPKVHGTPARYARTLRARAALNMLIVGALIVPVALWWSDSPTSRWRDAVALLAATVVMTVVYDTSKAYARANAGVVSESQVLRALQKTSATHVINGAKPAGRGGDVDHVVAGPMLAVIETKTGRGNVTVKGDQLRVGTRPLKGATISGARRQARSIGEMAGAEASAVICIVDMDGPAQEHQGVTICSAGELSGVVDLLPEVLSQESASRLPEQLLSGQTAANVRRLLDALTRPLR